MGLLIVLAGIVTLAAAALQAADALGRLTLRSYPFLATESRALKWAYVGWLVFMAIGAIVLGILWWPLGPSAR